MKVFTSLNVKQVLIILLIIWGIQISGFLLVGILGILIKIDLIKTALSNLILILIISICTIYYINKKLGSPSLVIFFKKTKILSYSLFIFFLSLICLIIICVEIEKGIDAIIPMPKDLHDILYLFGNEKGRIWWFISVAIITPFYEEFIFRGLILNGLLIKYSQNKAIILSSLFFAIAHLNIYQGVTAFFIGLYFAWIFVKTKSLIPCIFGHFLVNSSGFIVDIFKIPISGYGYNDTTNNFLPVSFTIISCILFICLVYFLNYTFKNNYTSKYYANLNRSMNVINFPKP